MHRRRRRTALLLSAAIAAAPLLTACGSDAHPGAVAVVGGQRITASELENRMGEVRAAQHDAAPDQAAYEQTIDMSGMLPRDLVHTMVLDEVLHEAARDAGVRVTRKETQRMRADLEGQAGGAKALETAWLQQYLIPPERIDDNLRLQLEAQKLAAHLGTDLGEPAFWNALAAASDQLHIRVNPRYGAWDVRRSDRGNTATPWVREVTAAGASAEG